MIGVHQGGDKVTSSKACKNFFKKNHENWVGFLAFPFRCIYTYNCYTYSESYGSKEHSGNLTLMSLIEIKTPGISSSLRTQTGSSHMRIIWGNFYYFCCCIVFSNQFYIDATLSIGETNIIYLYRHICLNATPNLWQFSPQKVFLCPFYVAKSSPEYTKLDT